MRAFVMEVIASEDVALFEKVRRAITHLPDVDLGVDEEGKKIILSCHVLGRAVARVFGVRYVDGYFAHMFEHTWLLTANNSVMDVYPVGILGGPILVDNANTFAPGRFLYRRTSTRKLSHGRFGRNSFKRSVHRVEMELRNIIRWEGE